MPNKQHTTPVKPNRQEHPFASFVRVLGRGRKGSRSLTEAEACQAMTMILDGEVEDVQLGAFLMLLRVKEETAEELTGFVKAARASIDTGIDTPRVDIDWSSYAGKKRQLNWYLLSALLLASNGFRVFMHGASGHTAGRIYSEDVLRNLGLPIADSWDEAKRQLQSFCFSYMPLRILCPTLYQIIELRNILGLRSPVHSFARLLNPLDSPAVIQGIFHPGFRPLHREVALRMQYQRMAVIKGDSGEIERDPGINCLVQWAANGESGNDKWPALNTRRSHDDLEMNIDSLRQTWCGDTRHEYGENAVTGTAAIALWLMGKVKTIAEAEQSSMQMWVNRNRDLL